MQLTYGQNMAKSIAGTLYDLSPRTIDSYVAETDTIALGMGVVGGTDPTAQVKLPSASVTSIKGIALLQAKEQAADGTVTYGNKDTLPVLHKGRAWAPVTGAVAADAQAYLVFSGANKGKWAAAAGIQAAGAAAAVAGNTGTGTITAAPATGSGCKVGTYQVRCIGGAPTATASTLSGKGALTMDASTPLLTGYQFGVYKAMCIAAASNAGTFAVYDPGGVLLGTHTVAGAAFATQIKFAIADGDTDFAVGDTFTITVAQAVAANSGVFSVADPDGVVIGNATVGTPFTTHLTFTIADGTSADFVIGDGFNIVVGALASAITGAKFLTSTSGAGLAVVELN